MTQQPGFEHAPTRATRRRGRATPVHRAEVTAVQHRHKDRRALVDITFIAEDLGDSVRHIRRLVHENRIPYLKVGHRLRFDRDEIDQWLEDNRPRQR